MKRKILPKSVEHLSIFLAILDCCTMKKFLLVLCTTAILNLSILHVAASNQWNTISSIYRNDYSNNKCLPGKWQCKNEECITQYNVCDGKEDCSDGSDETFSLCRNTRCPPFVFQCVYGACIDIELKCNGKQNCRDNSDELHKDCLKNNVNEIPRHCPKTTFQCGSGECLSIYSLCDGKLDCSDGSDETISECSNKRCIPYLFQCAYGACVDGDAICNGVFECADGSDESFDLCSNSLNSWECDLPMEMINQGSNNGHINQIKVNRGTSIKYICKSGEEIISSCYGGKWSKELRCPKMCYKPSSSSDMNFYCHLPDGTFTSCGHPMDNGILINAICKNGGKKVLRCIDGQWNDTFPICDDHTVNLLPQGVKISIDVKDNIEIHITDLNNVLNKSNIKIYNNSTKTVRLDEKKQKPNYDSPGYQTQNEYDIDQRFPTLFDSLS